MTIKKIAAASLIAFGAIIVAVPLTAFAKSPDMKMLDPDSDGTVSLAEAQAAGAKKFAMLDPDSDGTIDMKESKGMMSKAAFKKADPDGDGTLDAKELKTPAGKKLLALIQ